MVEKMNYIHEDIKLRDETTWFKIFSFKAKNLDKIIHKHNKHFLAFVHARGYEFADGVKFAPF